MIPPRTAFTTTASQALAPGLLVIALLLLGPAPVAACGTWTLEDAHGTRSAVFFVNAVLEGPAGRRSRVLTIHGERTGSLQARTTDGIRLRFEGARLISAGRAIGHLEGRVLRVGRQRYEIIVTTRNAEPARLPLRVQVWEGRRKMAQGNALAFCQCHACGPEEARTDVRRRVALYLAARSR